MADITAATGPTEDGAIEARRSTRAHERSKETRASVVYGERIARAVITVGGLMVIVAVLGIMVFLVRVGGLAASPAAPRPGRRRCGILPTAALGVFSAVMIGIGARSARR
jgi:ABC-type uncharacterized transport system permease subunit